MIILGLTGSIGMGKSTTANMFRNFGIPIHDADAAVHDLYAGAAVPLVETAFPGTIRDGVVDRNLLGQQVVGKPAAMKQLESIIHPLVAKARDQFIENAKAEGAWLVVLDVPLLFETGGEKHCDHVVVVTADQSEQRRRVLSRENMSAEKFEKILASQIPDSEKRKRADFIIDTSHGIEDAKEQVRKLLDKLKNGIKPNA